MRAISSLDPHSCFSPKHWITCKCMVTKGISCNLGLRGSSSYLVFLTQELWNFQVPQGVRESKEKNQHYPLVAAKQYGNKFWQIQRGKKMVVSFHTCCNYGELHVARKAIKTEVRCDMSWGHRNARAGGNCTTTSTLLHLPGVTSGLYKSRAQRFSSRWNHR